MRRAAAAATRGQARRECPVTVTGPDGSLLEGVVDLAFEEDGAWMVVDFKTDRELSQASIEQYSRQAGLYAAAIARATGRPARACLLQV